MADEKLPTITRKEADEEVRMMNFRCRGPNLHSLEKRIAFTKRFNEAATPEDHAKLLEDVAASLHMKEGLRKKTISELRDAALAAPAEQRQDRIRDLSFKMINGHADSIDHAGCGADIGALIVADGQYDGEDHPLTCPECGTKTTYSKFARLAPETAEAAK